MKKTIFTICSIALVCCTIIISCTKDSTSGETQVGYYSQGPHASGTNPNPNPTGQPYQTPTVVPTPTTTTTNTTVTTNTTTTNFSVDGAAANNPTASGFASSPNFIVEGVDGSGTPSIQITFPGTSAPASGVYIIVGGTPTGNQCNFLLSTAAGSSTASAGTVVVTAAASPNNTASFTSISCSGGGGSHTVSGAFKY